MQASLYQLIQDRRVGDYVLPKRCEHDRRCGNRESDRGRVHTMLSPLASRFVHIDVGKPNMIAYAKRLRPELAEYMVDCATRRDASLRYGKAWIEWETWINRQ